MRTAVFLMKRVGFGFVAIILATFAAFLAFRVLDPDPAVRMLGPGATTAQLAAKTSELGLDGSLWEQYGVWALSASRGDLGRSWQTGASVADLLLASVPLTILLALLATVLSGVLGAGLGLLATTRTGPLDRLLERCLRPASTALALAFTIGLTLAFLAERLMFPVSTPGDWTPLGWLAAIILPLVALTVGSAMAIARHVRATTLAALTTDCVRTLRSRGLGRARILGGHVLRSAAPGGLPILLRHFGALFGAVIVIEALLVLPGLGSLATSSAAFDDTPVLMGVMVVFFTVILSMVVLLDAPALGRSVRAGSQ